MTKDDRQTRSSHSLKVFDCALRLLANREHGAQELAAKLRQKGYESAEITDAIAECQRLGLQDDGRFAEAFCQARIRQGCGPIKISQELKARQIDPALVEQVLKQEQEQWFRHALAVWHKKYKIQSNCSFVELQKQQRFLYYRGFTNEIIALVIAEIHGTIW